jgi:2,4-dienoyl-CoA reductase-like NADH-dependent reductase (Old Yellow Enzyme family)/threonine dehydrogenase-like Zn-dependent dehydrogenase
MSDALVRVWEPLQLGPIELRNRIVRAAHTTALAGQGVGDALIAYHLERARGGVALSVIEAAGVHPTCVYGIPIQDDAVIPGLRRLVEAVRPEGMHLIQQLFHIGPHGPSSDGSPSWAASDIPGAAPGMLSHAMTVEEIAEVTAGFAAGARRCREAGVAGVEIHCSHGYLLHAFLSRATNRRDDDYGGSFEKRLRFTREVLAAIRAQVGEDYLVGVRLSTEDGVEQGLDARECARVAQALEATGQLDYVSLSCGNSFYQPSRLYSPLPAPHAYELPFSREVTRAVSLPTMVSGRFITLDDAEQALAQGDADLVSMVRALLADPQLVAKARAGRSAQTRPCIGCNQACVGGIRRYDGQSGAQRLECTVNAACGHELTHGDGAIERASSPLRVLVAGGGPAGLEAARVAALAGHSVVLHERGDRLGGQLRLARANPARAETGLALDWWQRELVRLGVEIELASDVDPALVQRAGTDVVIVATGSLPRRDVRQALRPAFALGGETPERAIGARELLDGAPVGDAAVVYDDVGHFEAIDVAEHLLARGVAVSFVTRFGTVGAQLDGGPFAWEGIGQPHLALMLGDRSFSLHPRSAIVAIDRDTVTIAAQDAPERSEQLDAATVVMVSSGLPERSLADSLADLAIDVRVVGDAIHGPKWLQHAVRSANEAARGLVARA